MGEAPTAADNQFDEEAARRMEQQIFDLWVKPELARRTAEGRSPDRFDAFQIVFSHPTNGIKKNAVEVRLNGEVQGLLKGKWKRSIEVGNPVFADDIESIDGIELLPQEADRAHITALRVNGIWITVIDLTYNRESARQHLAAAGEFLQAAKDAHNLQHWRPFVDNLFSAAELIAKAELMITPTRESLASHKVISIDYNSWAKLGNVPRSSRDAFNKLARLRGSARYLKSGFRMQKAEADSLLQGVGDAFIHTNDRV